MGAAAGEQEGCLQGHGPVDVGGGHVAGILKAGADLVNTAIHLADFEFAAAGDDGRAVLGGVEVVLGDGDGHVAKSRGRGGEGDAAGATGGADLVDFGAFHEADSGAFDGVTAASDGDGVGVGSADEDGRVADRKGARGVSPDGCPGVA